MYYERPFWGSIINARIILRSLLFNSLIITTSLIHERTYESRRRIEAFNAGTFYKQTSRAL